MVGGMNEVVWVLGAALTKMSDEGKGMDEGGRRENTAGAQRG